MSLTRKFLTLLVAFGCATCGGTVLYAQIGQRGVAPHHSGAGLQRSTISPPPPSPPAHFGGGVPAQNNSFAHQGHHHHGGGYGGYHSGYWGGGYRPGFYNPYRGYGYGGYGYPGYGYGGYGMGGYGYGSYGYGSFGFPGFGYSRYGYYGSPSFSFGYTLPGPNWDPGWGYAPMARQYDGVGPVATSFPNWPVDPNQNVDPVNQLPSPSQVAQQASPFRQSSVQEQHESLVWMEQGDRFRYNGQYSEALNSYRRSIEIAQDQPLPRMKGAILLAESQQYNEAVHQLRSALALDPESAVKAKALSEFFGPRREQTIHNMLQATAQWARGDIRDPQRLLLVGTLLMLSGDLTQAEIPLLAAQKLSPNDPQVQQMLVALNNLKANGGVSPAGFTKPQPPNSLPSGSEYLGPEQFGPRPEPSPVNSTDEGPVFQPVPKRKSTSDSSAPETKAESAPVVVPPKQTTPEATPPADSSEESAEEDDGPTFPGAMN